MQQTISDQLEVVHRFLIYHPDMEQCSYCGYSNSGSVNCCFTVTIRFLDDIHYQVILLSLKCCLAIISVLAIFLHFNGASAYNLVKLSVGLYDMPFRVQVFEDSNFKNNKYIWYLDAKES